MMTPVWTDLLALTWAFILFPLVILIPGYVIGRLTNVFGFKTETHSFHLALLLSLVICPWALYIFQRFIGMEAVWAFFIASWIVAIVLLVPKARKIRLKEYINSSTLLKLTYFALAFLFVSFMLIDMENNGRLIRPLMTHDYVKHVAVSDAISRTGIPPVNPSFHPVESIQLFYYYFWFLLCSAIDLIGGTWINARAAVLGSILWCFVLLVSITRVYVIELVRAGMKGLKSSEAKWGYLLLLITGLDFLPILLKGYHISMSGGRILPDVLWWNEIIASWSSAVLWVPHHVGAFICCLVAFLAVIRRPENSPVRLEPSLILASIALSASLGMSIWVTIVASWVLATWFLFAIYKGWKQEVLYLLCLGILSILISLPFILDIQQSNNLDTFPLAFHVRPFYYLDVLLADMNPWFGFFLNFLLLPINYFFELGFFLLGAWMYWTYRKKQKTPLNKAEFFILHVMWSSLFFCTFFRANIINNDLGWRGFMFVQFVLLIYSIPLLKKLCSRPTVASPSLPPTLKNIAIIAIFLSMLTMVTEIYVRRAYPWGPNHSKTVSIRAAHEWADYHLEQDAIIQHNPDEYIEYFHALYGNRQVIVSDYLYGRLYGINDAMFDSTYKDMVMLFQKDASPDTNVATAYRYGIDAILLKNSDPAWNDPNHWTKDLPVVFENNCCRIHTLK